MDSVCLVGAGDRLEEREKKERSKRRAMACLSLLGVQARLNYTEEIVKDKHQQADPRKARKGHS